VPPNDKALAQMTPEEAAMQDLLQQQPPQGPQYGITNNTPEPGMLGKYVIPAIAPTLGSMAGTAGGTMIGGPVGGVVGSGLGSGAGEAVNQMLGITDPSMTNIGISTALPMAVGFGANALRAGKAMFGAKGAQTLNSLAPEEAAAAIAKLQPEIPSKFLFESATEGGASIPMKRTLSSIQNMMDDLGGASKGVQQANRTALNYLKGLQEKLTAMPNGLSPKDLQRELAGAGSVMQSAKAKGGAGLGAIKNVFKSMSDDLDEVANMADQVGTNPAMLLKEARQVFKKEAAINELDDAISGAVKQLRGQGADGQFNANLVMNAMKKNDFIQQAFSPQEIKEMESLFAKLNRIPALRPGAGQQAGSRSVLQGPVAGSGIGAGISTLLGQGPSLGAAVGAAAGVVLPPLAEATKNVAVAMSMKAGRQLLGKLLSNSDGALTPQALSIISAYAQAVNAGAESAVTGQ